MKKLGSGPSDQNLGALPSYGLGWKPKWDKWRQVPLFDDAVELLEYLPRQEKVYGTVPVRDENKEIIGHKIYPANFVFPQKVVDGEEW